MLLRHFGSSIKDITLDETIREAVIGDRYLLCSDGLSGVVSCETIQDVMNSVEDLMNVVKNLFLWLCEWRKFDNITYCNF